MHALCVSCVACVYCTYVHTRTVGDEVQRFSLLLVSLHNSFVLCCRTRELGSETGMSLRGCG